MTNYNLTPPFKAYDHYITDSKGTVCLTQISDDCIHGVIFSIVNKLNGVYPVTISDVFAISGRLYVDQVVFAPTLQGYFQNMGYDSMESSSMNREFTSYIANKLKE